MDSVVCDKLQSACHRLGLRPRITDLRPEMGSKVRRWSKFVWVIGAWNLVIVCYVLFGACNFLFKDATIFKYAVRLFKCIYALASGISVLIVSS